MIDFRFGIAWPWAKERGENKHYFTTYNKLTENKSLETQLSRWSSCCVLFSINLNTEWIGSDHAGIKFDIQIWRLNFMFDLYDKRHWNYEEARWQTLEEAKAEDDEWRSQTLRNEE